MYATRAIAFFYFVLSLGIFAAAMPGGHPTTTTVTVTATPTPTGTPGGTCSTGPVQCCNSVQSASSPGPLAILGLLGIVLDDLTVLVGLNCNSLNVIGGQGACAGKVTCCQNNSFGSLISIGCVVL